MSQELQALDWGKVIQPEKFNPNLSLDRFEKALTPIINKFIPLEKLKNKEHKRKYKPWISNGIITSIKKRDKLLNQYIKTKNLMVKQTILNQYKHYRNSIVDLIKKSKLIFYKNYFTQNSKNLK